MVKRVLPKVKSPSSGNLTVRETVYFGQRKSLHIVQVGRKKLLIAATRESVSMLSDVTDAFDPDTPHGEGGGEE